MMDRINLFACLLVVAASATAALGEERLVGETKRSTNAETQAAYSDTESIPRPLVESIVPATSRPDWFRGSMSATWIGRNGDDGLGMTSFSLRSALTAPIPKMQLPLTASASFGMTFLDGPSGLDLPPRLYRAGVSFGTFYQYSDKTRIMFSISPGYSGDLESFESDSFRFMASLVATHQWTDEIDLLFGVAYTGRNDVPVLPFAGLIWKPTEDWRIELTAPRPRIAHRVRWFGDDCGDWVYAAAEFGGGTWGVERSNGRDDELTIREFRLLVGWERKTRFGITPRIELGYVFGRKVEYENDNSDFDPSDSVMFRAGLNY